MKKVGFFVIENQAVIENLFSGHCCFVLIYLWIGSASIQSNIENYLYTGCDTNRQIYFLKTIFYLWLTKWQYKWYKTTVFVLSVSNQVSRNHFYNWYQYINSWDKIENCTDNSKWIFLLQIETTMHDSITYHLSHRDNEIKPIQVYYFNWNWYVLYNDEWNRSSNYFE